MLGWLESRLPQRYYQERSVGTSAGCGPKIPHFVWHGQKTNKLARKEGNAQILSSCCCCCWVASVVSDSVRPHRQQPTRLPCPWDSPGKNTWVGCHFLLQCMKVKSEREVTQCVWLLATPWTVAHQAPPPMGFSREEYWSWVPLPSLPLITIRSKILK